MKFPGTIISVIRVFKGKIKVMGNKKINGLGFHYQEFQRQRMLLEEKVIKSLPKKINNPLNKKELIQEIREYIKKEKEIFHNLY